MSAPETSSPVPNQLETNKTISFTFTFARQWHISPVDSVSADGTHIMPPGGGLSPHNVTIGPAQFAGKTVAEVADIVRERTAVLAMVSEAVALSAIEFSDALGLATSGKPS